MPAFGEIPAPSVEWLKSAMRGKWADAGDAFDHASWRRAVLDAVTGFGGDTVVFTHFVAINVAVGAALGSDDVVCFRPDYASITRLQCLNGKLEIAELGRQAETTVLTRG